MGWRRALSGAAYMQQDMLDVVTAGSGYTVPEVLGLLQAVAASIARALVVLPLPPAAAGRLRVAVG